MDVIVDPDVLEDNNSTIVLLAIEKMKSDPYRDRSKKRGRKWIEVVEVMGVKYAVTCRNEITKDVIIGFRRARYAKG